MLEIKDCQRCKKLLLGLPKEPFIKHGKNNKVLLVGEFPKTDSRDFFYNQDSRRYKSAERLDEYLRLLDLSLESISFTEMCKCSVDDRKKLKEVATNCYKHLISQIETLKPKLVITVGTIARDVFIEENKLQIIMGETVRIDGYHYLPLYHPSPANPVGHRKNIEIITNNRKQLLSIIK